MTRFLKIRAGEWKNESRDKREISVCKELGMDVFVLAKEDDSCEDYIDDLRVYRASSRPWRHMPNSINRLVSLLTWAKQARNLKPDIISGHDLPGLAIGYLSTLFLKRGNKPQLVYDSHEFELGRNADRTKLSIFFIKLLEGYLMRRCAFSIMVNDEIANVVQGIHHLTERPVVARNTPFYWEIDKDVTNAVHHDFCEELKAPENSFFVMYHGGVIHDRGVETLIKVVGKNTNIYGVILGNGESSYLESLNKLAYETGASSRLLFKPAVPLSELWKYVGAANVGLIMIPAICENHRLCLPNKFFENIQSETPVVCPDYPAMKGVVEKYNNGIACDVSDVNVVFDAIERLRNDKTLYTEKKKGALLAKQDLCWEKEKKQLKEAYKRILN